MPYVPTIGGRQLARELRYLRERAGMTGEQAAKALDWEQSKISRMETGKMRVTAGEVMELCVAYDIDGNERARLVQLARDARKKGWWHAYSDYVKKGFIDYLAFEAEARAYRGYEAQILPGVFQIEAYARAIFRGSYTLTTEEVDRGVELRLARQERIRTSTNPLNIWAIIDEAAIRRVVDGPDVMRAQLDHLLQLSELANVSLQVLPYQAGVHAAVDGPFVLLSFDGYPDLLYIEHLMGCLYSEKRAETAQGSLIFDHLRSAALNVADSAKLIRRVAEELV